MNSSEIMLDEQIEATADGTDKKDTFDILSESLGMSKSAA